MQRKEEFEKWEEEYFCNQQGEDSPYSREDIKQAFYNGWKKAKSIYNKQRTTK